MKFTLIDGRIKEYFYDLDPYDLLGQQFPTNTYALGEYIDDLENDCYIAVGLAILAVTNHSVVIKWMYVDEQYRGQGIGSQLLDKLFRFARDNNKEFVNAFFFKAMARHDICAGERAYFFEKGFYQGHKDNYLIMRVDDYLGGTDGGVSFTTSLYTDNSKANFWNIVKPGIDSYITLLDLESLDVFNQKSDLRGVKSFAEVGKLEFIRQLTFCKRKKKLGLFQNLSDDFSLDYIEPELSCFIDRGKGLEAILVVVQPEINLLMPVILCSFTDDHVKDLLSVMLFSFDRAIDKYGTYTRVLFRGYNDRTKEAIKQIVANKSHDYNCYSQDLFKAEVKDIASAYKTVLRLQLLEFDNLSDNDIVVRIINDATLDFIETYIGNEAATLYQKSCESDENVLVVALDSIRGTVAGASLISRLNDVATLYAFNVVEEYDYIEVAKILFSEITAFADRASITTIEAPLNNLDEDIAEGYKALGFMENESQILVLNKQLN